LRQRGHAISSTFAKCCARIHKSMRSRTGCEEWQEFSWTLMQRYQGMTTENSVTNPSERKGDGHSGVRRASQKVTSPNVGPKFSTYVTISTTTRLAPKMWSSLASATKPRDLYLAWRMSASQAHANCCPRLRAKRHITLLSQNGFKQFTEQSKRLRRVDASSLLP